METALGLAPLALIAMYHWFQGMRYIARDEARWG